MPEPVLSNVTNRPLLRSNLALHPRSHREPQDDVFRRRRPVRGLTLVPVLVRLSRGHALVQRLFGQLDGGARERKCCAHRSVVLAFVDDSYRGVYRGALGVAAYDLCVDAGWWEVGGVSVWVSGWRVCGSIANGGAFVLGRVRGGGSILSRRWGAHSCAGERWDLGAHLGDVDDARAILDVFRRDVRLHPLLDRGDRFLRGEGGGVPR